MSKIQNNSVKKSYFRNNPKSKSRIITWTLITLSILAIFVFGYLGAHNQKEKQLDKVVLQLRWSPQFQFSGYYAAKLKGFYEEEGIEVEIRHAIDDDGNIKIATSEVIDGNADFGIGGVDVLIANDKGADLSIVASIFQRSPVEYYMLEDTTFNSVLDFLNKNTARRYDDLLDIELQAMLLSEGIEPFEDSFISKNQDLTVEDLTSGRFDIIPGYLRTHEYNGDKLGIKLKSIKPIDYGIDFYGDSIFTTKELASTSPELVERFRRASLKGWKYALENPEELIKVIPPMISEDKHEMQEAYSFNKFQSQAVTEYTLYPVVELGNINPHRWETMYSTLKKLHLINKDQTTDDYIFDYQKILAIEESKSEQSIFAVLIISFISALVAFLIHLSTKNTLLEKEITERQEAELKITRSKERYQAIFNSAVLGITITTDDGRIVQSNDMWQKMTGYNEAELCSMKISDLIHPDDKPLTVELMTKLRSGEMENYVEEKRYLTKDGSYFWGKLFMTSIYDQDVEKKVNLGMILDITSIKIEEETVRRSEERFRNIINEVAIEIGDTRDESYSDASLYESDGEKNRLSLKLERINLELERMFKKELDENKKKEALLIYQARLAAMGEMIANIAHQWRQPLNNLGLILGNIEDAFNYNELDKEYMEKSVDKSLKLIKKMSSTIDDFRYFLNPKNQKTRFDIKASIEDVFELFEENLRFNQITPSITTHPLSGEGPILGYGYENQFSQAVFNIVTNSIDAMISNGSSRKHIAVDIFEYDKSIAIEMQDVGGGIDNAILDMVFDLYFTTKDSTKGTGLGLYMTKTIIENNLNGSITIENKDDGLKTTVIIPKEGDTNELND